MDSTKNKESKELDLTIVNFLNDFGEVMSKQYKESGEQNFAFVDQANKANYPLLYTKNYILTYTGLHDKYTVFAVVTADLRELANDVKRLEAFAQMDKHFEFVIAQEYAFVDMKNQKILWGEPAENRYNELRLQALIDEYKLIESYKTGVSGNA